MIMSICSPFGIFIGDNKWIQVSKKHNYSGHIDILKLQFWSAQKSAVKQIFTCSDFYVSY